MKARRRRFGNAVKERRLRNVLAYAVCNMQTLQGEPGRCRLRAISRLLHLTCTGMRARYAGFAKDDEIVRAFLLLTAWCDLLTPAEWAAGEKRLSEVVDKASCMEDEDDWSGLN